MTLKRRKITAIVLYSLISTITLYCQERKFTYYDDFNLSIISSPIVSSLVAYDLGIIDIPLQIEKKISKHFSLQASISYVYVPTYKSADSDGNLFTVDEDLPAQNSFIPGIGFNYYPFSHDLRGFSMGFRGKYTITKEKQYDDIETSPIIGIVTGWNIIRMNGFTVQIRGGWYWGSGYENSDFYFGEIGLGYTWKRTKTFISSY